MLLIKLLADSTITDKNYSKKFFVFSCSTFYICSMLYAVGSSNNIVIIVAIALFIMDIMINITMYFR